MERYEVTFVKNGVEKLDIVTASTPDAAGVLVRDKHGPLRINRIERLIITDWGVVTGSRIAYLEPQSQLRPLVQGIMEATVNSAYLVLGLVIFLTVLVGVIWLVKDVDLNLAPVNQRRQFR